MKKLIIILVVILACILIVGGVLIVMGTMSEKPQQETTIETTTEETGMETETTIPETKETEPTETVVVTTAKETQEETTEAATTAAPTTEEAKPTEGSNILPEVQKKDIDGTVTGSGSFASSTGAELDVQVNWQAFKDSGGSRKVRLDISLNCCNIYVGARYDGLTITLGDTVKTLNTDAIEYTGSSTNILIGSIIMDLPEGATDCTVSWAFRGSYNQVKIDNIIASGTIN